MLVLKQLQGLVEALASMHEPSANSPGHNGRNATQPPSLSPGRNKSRNATSLEVPLTSVNGNPLPAISIDGPDDSRGGRGGSPALIVSPPESGEQDSAGDERRGRSASQGSDIWRHGDIKPENILRFIEGKDDAWIGTLKLADLGRAQKHSLMTQLRETREKEPWRTKWYEPPDLVEEVHERAQGKISRLFDIWSIGCVIFEVSLWLLYGYDSIQKFLDANRLATNEQSATPYWKKRGYGRYEVSETATQWMNHILQYDHERDCAIGDLVKLVRDRLLKVDLPPHSSKYLKGFRTNAADLKEQLHEIIAKAERDEKYLFSGFDRSKITSIAPHSELPNPNQISKPGSRSSLDPKDAEIRGPFVYRGSPTEIAQKRQYTDPIADQWEVSDDEAFKRSNIGDCQLPSDKPELCEACKNMDISSPEISFDRDTVERNWENETCGLCDLIYSVTIGRKFEDSKKIVLIRKFDSFVLAGTDQKLLRLCHTGDGKFCTFFP
jgi:serine/threonine protein kinase